MYPELPYRGLLAVVAILQTAISAYYVWKARAFSTIFRRREEGFVLSSALGVTYLVYGASVLVYLLNPAWMAWSAIDAPSWLRWSGVAPLLLGAAFEIWGLKHLDANLAISINTRDGHNLVTTGPYRWVRHPLYTGGMVESLGVGLITSNGSVTFAAFMFWALIVWRTPREEERLVATFGERYREYQQQTGRYLPRAVPSVR
jgi:protein-S-isoprenylcysteine O-methyltransferase Ste14